jgi:hypothetical protein
VTGDPASASASASASAAAARRAVDAWELAVNGDDAALAAMAEPDVIHWLMHPVYKPWQIAPRPSVTSVRDTPGAEPALLWVRFEFSGRRRFTDPPGQDDSETPFAGLLELRQAGDGAWRLTSGQVQTLDEYLGYVFTSRRETLDEYRRRVPGSPGPAGTRLREAAAGPVRGFRLLAGFAEHDEKFGSTAEVVIRRGTAPSREEAVQIVWPALEEEAARALGAGQWRLSLNWLDLIELLDEPPDAGTATE